MGKKSTPPAPDYSAMAEKTANSQNQQANLTTWADRANQVTPWGTMTWNTQQVKDPATGQMVNQWTQNTTLSPDQQQQFYSQQRIATDKNQLAETLIPRMQQEYGSAADYSSLTPWATAPMQTGNLSPTTSAYGFGGPRSGSTQNQYNYNGLQNVQGADAARQQATSNAYTQAASRLDPQWQQQQASLESSLANKGITQGSDAYNQAMTQFNQQKTDAYNQANYSAIAQGGTAAQQQQGMDLSLRQQQAQEAQNQTNLFNQMQQQKYAQGLSSGQYGLQQQQQAFGQQQAASGQNFQQQLQANTFQNQQRNQQLTEMMQQRGMSLNEINAILSGTQVGMPQFGGYSQATGGQGVDYSGAAKDQYSASMDAYNAAQANSPLNAAASLAGTAMKAYTMGSDRRIKQDIKRIGKHPRGYGRYRFRYIGMRGWHEGVIAQEVQRYAPELVTSVNGILHVNLSAL